MRTFGRFTFGFAIGCILIVWSVGLGAGGHGTIAPLFSAAPEMLLVLVAAEKWGLSGFWLVVVPIAGLLWATYFVCLLLGGYSGACRAYLGRPKFSVAQRVLLTDNQPNKSLDASGGSVFLS